MIAAATVRYVAADLTWFDAEPDEAQHLARDLTQADSDGKRRAYRRLDLDWYQWLHARMRDAKALVAAGSYSADRYAAARARFIPLAEFIAAHHDAAAIAHVHKHWPDAKYRAPVPIPHR